MNEENNRKQIKAYTLLPEKQNLGIADDAFVSEKKAIISSKSKYKNQFLYDLMKLKKEGNYYLFEDDNVIIYDATAPTKKSSCYVQIKDTDVI